MLVDLILPFPVDMISLSLPTSIGASAAGEDGNPSSMQSGASSRRTRAGRCSEQSGRSCLLASKALKTARGIRVSRRGWPRGVASEVSA